MRGRDEKVGTAGLRNRDQGSQARSSLMPGELLAIWRVDEDRAIRQCDHPVATAGAIRVEGGYGRVRRESGVPRQVNFAEQRAGPVEKGHRLCGEDLSNDCGRHGTGVMPQGSVP